MIDSKMKKVLMVTYAFPPVGGAGVQRSTKFIKYLKHFGWEPIVLSVKNPSVPLYDPHQTADIPLNTKIYRAKTLEPRYKIKRLFFEKEDMSRYEKARTGVMNWVKSGLMIPDPQILWWPALILSLWEIIKKESVNCLFVTAPPFSSLVPVVFVGKVLGIPVVIDFRDDWRFYRLHMENAVKTPVAALVDRILERYVVLNCAAFTAATASYVKNLMERYSFPNPKKGHVITNGYDANDFCTFQEKFKAKKNDQKIHFLYSGTVWRATSLLPFLKAISLLVRDYPDIKAKLQITIMGRVVGLERNSFLNGCLQSIVDLKGYVPHNEVIEALGAADVLIITLSDVCGADQIIPAKTFEYMATGKHILAIVPEGETSRLLTAEYENAAIFHPNETDLIKKHVLKLVTDQKTIFEKKKIDILKFERKALAGKLAAVFSSLMGNVNDAQ